MAEYKLGRIRFVWKDSWTTGTIYYVDDVVRLNGKTYICQVGHTSSADFNTDLEFSPTKWDQLTDGQSFEDEWQTSNLYQLNDVVKYGGNLYICTDSHTSAATDTLGLETDQSKWSLFVEGTDWKGDWSTSIRYKVNDVVRYGGYTYLCNNAHISNSDANSGLEADQSKWDTYNPGIEFKGAWNNGIRYKINDVVKYGSGLWICITYHTSGGGFSGDSANWNEFVKGIEFDGAWIAGTEYQAGTIVTYGGNQYIAKTIHNSTSLPPVDPTNWDLFNEGFNFANAWSISTDYKINDVVSLAGYNFIAVQDSPSINFNVTITTSGTNIVTTSLNTGIAANMAVRFTGTAFGILATDTTYFVKQVVGGTQITLSDTPGGAVKILTSASGSMTAEVAAHPSNTNYWQVLTEGIAWSGEWEDDREYDVGEAVRFGSNAYICVQKHRSEGDDGSTIGPQGGGAANSRPDLDSTGTYWNILCVGSELDVLTVKGDLVFYSDAGPTRLPVGTEGQILRVSTDLVPEWTSLASVDHVYFVALTGTDLPSPIWGKSFDKPWKSIRYACEQVENGPRNPAAKRLLELNRVFIQRETTEFIQNQITNNIAPFTSAFVYDDFKCERDIGFIIDAFIYDVSHGGNIKSRGAANSLIGGLSPEETEAYPGLTAEYDETIAAYSYALSVVEDVLAQTAPAVNYQTINGDNSTAVVTQYFDADLTAETGAYTTIVGLLGIITAAITARAAAVTEAEIAAAIASVPDRRSPSNLIRVATGQYREILPIIVPEQTCVQGDELRSTNTGPAGVITNLSDAAYSVGTLSRMETVVGEIIQGINVTETAGNTAIQSAEFPFASADEAVTLRQLVRVIQQNIDFRLNSNLLVDFPGPTGYNISYLTGFGSARALLKLNKEFIKDEIIAFITVNFAAVKYSRTARKREIGVAVDAMLYDLTVGGYTQTLDAGLAYFNTNTSTLTLDTTELASTIAAYNRFKTIVQQIIANTTVTKSNGNTATQFTDATNLTGGSAANSFVGTGIDIIINLLTAESTTGRPSITVTTITGTDTLTTAAAHGLAAGDLVVPRTTGNGVTAGTRYYVIAAGLTATEFQIGTSFAGSAETVTNGAGLSLVFNFEDRPAATDAVTTTTALISAYTTLSAQVSTIVSAMTAYLTANFPTVIYDPAGGNSPETNARRILDAVSYDFMFGSNNQTRNAALNYLRNSALDTSYSIALKTATRAAFTFVKTQALANVGGNATAQASIELLMTLLDDIIYSGSNEGSRCATSNRMLDYAVLQLERNRDYIVAEMDAYIDATYTTTVTAATAATDVFTCASTAWMQRNAAIRFTGTVFGGVNTTTTYYVQNVVSATEFKIATTRDTNTAFDITADAAGTMTVALYYDTASCQRDVNTYIDAVKYDLKYPGNYKSLYAARYYANAVVGSQEENMYLLRDATGVRDQTTQGLTGDLLPPNEFGTSRVSAGAYCSLDPGWGPEDYRTWIITRSPYVQGVTTFGTAAIGQKIDGALHNGGNDSIVSNDFTQVISDGIGAWITNNGRAELVSVFSYYAHIGYLAENGGRIRGANGNNSYGDFGSVAEGVDPSETPGTAVVDNKFQFKATVGSAFGNASKFFQLEFDNAGIDYTEVVWTFTGGGISAASENDEFRDDAVYQVRLLDFGDDSSGQFGGEGYLSNANTSQGGTSTSLTLAATDGEISAAYVGMVIYITGGTGVGQYGVVSTYNGGTKVAAVLKEDGSSGWEHVIPGTAIVSPDASSTYVVEPRISFTSPEFSNINADLPAAGTWTGCTFGATNFSYLSLTGTYSGTSGSGATFTVIRNGYKYIPVIQSAGSGYNRLETITIDGANLGGITSTNDLVITITAVNSSTGAILEVDQDGYGIGGTFVAVQSGSRQTATSQNGTSWTDNALALPSTASWADVAYGTFNDGSTLERTDTARFVAVATGGTAAAYSTNGVTWTASTLPASANWSSVAFGNGRFVAVASDSTTVAVSFDGEFWDVTGTLPSTGFVSVAYGAGYFVAVKTGDTGAVAYSTTGSGTWTADDMPASSTWTSVTWGNNKFVAVASDSNSGAYSLDFGQTWSAMTIGSVDGSSTSGFQKVKYGQGLFMATAYQAAVEDYSFVVTSENGVDWTVRAVDTPAGVANSFSGWNALAFGTPQRTGKWAVLPKDSEQTTAWIRTGATARARAFVAEEKIFAVRIIEPGSGYDSVPTMTITDPNNIYEAPFTVRLGKGVLGQPSWVNRGTGYTTASVEVNSGDGYADFFQPGAFVAVRRMTVRPVAGSNVVFAGLPGRTFKLVNLLTFLGTNAGAFTAFYQVSPELTIAESTSLTHLSGIETRLRYSQVRLTGHDFLDIGTGSFTETNYPGTPTQDPIQANETSENGGGRVFFTATDQDGNFRVGDLFSVEQATGVATLNADAFNISGLQELSLGNVTLGGGSATITEFSTDPFFTADSDSIIPTQRAIKAYIANQIGGGGAALNVNSVTAGSIKISSNTIENITGAAIKMNAVFEFRGGITGLPTAFHYFLR